MSSELSTIEVNRLEHLERVVAKGMKSFVDVGMALAEIQGSRLYRQQFETFEDYCRERWNFTASRGRQLVGAVTAIAALPDDLPKPASATQAEALARIADADRRTEVWSVAIERSARLGRQPTAREIGEINDEMDRIFDDNPAGASTRSRGEDEIAIVNPLFIELHQALRRASDLASTLSKTSAREWLLTSGSAMLKHIRDAQDHVRAAKPAGICPLCGGKGCAKCFETGWMNSTRFNSAKPSK